MPIKETGRIARRTERILFQKNEAYTDKYKNHINAWADYFSCYAYAGTYQASEDGDVVVTDERSVTFEARWCPELADAVSTQYRIVFRGENFNILSVDMMNYQRKTIRFICRKEKR